MRYQSPAFVFYILRIYYELCILYYEYVLYFCRYMLDYIFSNCRLIGYARLVIYYFGHCFLVIGHFNTIRPEHPIPPYLGALGFSCFVFVLPMAVEACHCDMFVPAPSPVKSYNPFAYESAPGLCLESHFLYTTSTFWLDEHFIGNIFLNPCQISVSPPRFYQSHVFVSPMFFRVCQFIAP